MTQPPLPADDRPALQEWLERATDIQHDTEALIVLARQVRWAWVEPIVTELRTWLAGSEEYDPKILDRVLLFKSDWSNPLYRTQVAELLAEGFRLALLFKPITSTQSIAQSERLYID